MREYEAYLVVAQNYLEACKQLLKHRNPLMETVTFLNYHAFESIAVSYITFHGFTFPMDHEGKLNKFVKILGIKKDLKIRDIEALVIALNGKRTLSLYPKKSKVKHLYITPSNQCGNPITDMGKVQSIFSDLVSLVV